LALALRRLIQYIYKNYQLTNSRLAVSQSFGTVSLTNGKISRARAALRRLGVWRGKVVAALRDSEPQSPEDCERELRERVFHSPQA